MRCITTGVDPDGRSVVTADEQVPEPELGVRLSMIDAREAASIVGRVPDAQPTPVNLVAGAIQCMLVRVGGRDEPSPPALPGVDADGFHTTPTIDYVIVVSGELELLLETGSVVLAPGDLVIQQATRHAWRSGSDEPARFLAVMTAPATS